MQFVYIECYKYFTLIELLSKDVKYYFYKNNELSTYINYLNKIQNSLYLILISYILFIFSFFGFISNVYNYLKYFFYFELGLLSSSLLFISGGILNNEISGQISALFLFSIAASETAIGLGILIFFFSIHKHVNLNFISI